METNKQATSEYTLHSLIKERWSARAFSPQPLTNQDVLTLLEAASWAASAMNEQPWQYFFALKGTPGFEAIWEGLLPGNQPWTKEAAALVVSVARKNHEKTGQPNHYYLHDTGMATANLLIQATSMGIHGHVMGGFDRKKISALLNVSEQEEVASVIALGYLGSAEQLPEPFKSRETGLRSRKPLAQISTDISSLEALSAKTEAAASVEKAG